MELHTFRSCAIAGCNNRLKHGALKYCSIKCSHLAQKKDNRQPSCYEDAPIATNPYCSAACKHGHIYRCRAETFFVRGGILGYVHPQFLARVLRDYYGERCLRCGWSRRHTKTGKVPIEVEHIDGNWENNRLTNLTLLCPNCHALTPTFRALNRGRGRAYRLWGDSRSDSQEPLRGHCAMLETRGFGAQPTQLMLLSPT
jgi:hypothetical protein